jgi:hypothetical protein
MEKGTKQLSPKTAHTLKTHDENIISLHSTVTAAGELPLFLPLLYDGESESTENLPVETLQLILCET